MTGYTTRRIPGVGGAELVCDVWDPALGQQQKPPGVLLVHGLASNARLYDGVAERLARAGRAVAAIDLRGHGRSGKPDTGYDYESMCGDVVAVLEALVLDPGEGFSRAVLVGQSFGGNLVLELAARWPERIAGIACIDGGTIDLRAGHSSWEKAAADLAPPKIAGARYEVVAARLRAAHPDWPETGISGSLANFEVRADGTVAPWLTLDRHMQILRTMWDSPPAGLYAGIHVPVLLLPAESPGAPAGWAAGKREAVNNALAGIERAEVHWFSPADHDVHAQYPDEVAAVLLEALQRLFV
ncbi:MAG: alpha/beta fold hydrolase [Acidimicrobiales bacterium]